jgi:hypothetical protein
MTPFIDTGKGSKDYSFAIAFMNRGKYKNVSEILDIKYQSILVN